MVENCPYTRQLKEKIDGSSDFRNRIQLQKQYLDYIEPLLCGKGLETMICCDPGENLAIRN